MDFKHLLVLFSYWSFCVDKPGAPGVRGAAAARGEFAPGGGAGGGAGGRCATQRAGAGAGAAQVADCQDGGLQEWIQLHIAYVLTNNLFLGLFLWKGFLAS